MASGYHTNSLNLRSSPIVVDPSTGRFAEGKYRAAGDTTTRRYILNTINRLALFSDTDLSPTNYAAIAIALERYGSDLPKEQRESLRTWLIERTAQKETDNGTSSP